MINPSTHGLRLEPGDGPHQPELGCVRVAGGVRRLGDETVEMALVGRVLVTRVLGVDGLRAGQIAAEVRCWDLGFGGAVGFEHQFVG